MIPPISQLAEEEEVLQYAASGLIPFGRVFMPQDFIRKAATPDFHYPVAKKLISTKPGSRICNVMFRHSAKSTLEAAAILYKIYFGEVNTINFIAWVCETRDQSLDHTGYIKEHIESNALLKRYFGPLDGSLFGKRWTQADFVTAKGDRIISKGTGQRLRGKKEGDIRYTGIVLDDFEGQENTKIKDRRDFNRKWLAGTVFPALDRTPGKEGWIWLSNTIVHYDSISQGIVDGYNAAKEQGTEKEYPWDVSFVMATKDGTFTPESEFMWPGLFGYKQLLEERRRFISLGQPHMFRQEYFNDARDRSSAPILTQKINYYTGTFQVKNGFPYIVVNSIIAGEGVGSVEHLVKMAVPVNVFVGADTAWTASRTSDYQAAIVLGIDAFGNRWVIDMIRERMLPFDFAGELIKIAKKYQPLSGFTIETDGGGETVRDIFDRFTFDERRLMPGLMRGVPAPRGIDKIDKLCQGLGSFVNSGKLFIMQEHQPLYDEMDEMPFPKFDDGMDGLYYADFYARNRRPRNSFPVKLDDFERMEGQERPSVRNLVKSRWNWYTGLRKK